MLFDLSPYISLDTFAGLVVIACCIVAGLPSRKR
jgi:hypothetical protein